MSPAIVKALAGFIVSLTFIVAHVWFTDTFTNTRTNTRTHTHPFNGPLSGTTQVSWYQKGKTNLDFY